MPPILGYMLSGVLIGPFFMNLIGNGEAIQNIKDLGDFGLLILMFVTGMHLDINTYTRNKSELLKPIKFTILQVIYSILFVLAILMIPFSVVHTIMNNYAIRSTVALALLIVAYLKNRIFCERIIRKRRTIVIIALSLCLYAFFFQERISCISDFLSNDVIKVITCAVAILSLNSTAVSLKLLEIRDKKNSQIGRKITEILVAQDLTLIAFIIFLKTLAGTGSFFSIFMKILSATGLMFLVDALAKTNPNPLSNFVEYVVMSSKELQILFFLSFGLFFAAACDYIGLSDIYGAFIAGMILGNLHHGSYIENKCRPIRDIFVTLFFVYVGVLLNVREIVDKLPIIALINLVILSFKYLSNYYINRQIDQRENHMSQSCMILSSLLLTQVSEFFLTLITLASTGILPDSPLGWLLDIFRQCCIVSLTFGCLITVLLKRFLYYRGTIA